MAQKLRLGAFGGFAFTALLFVGIATAADLASVYNTCRNLAKSNQAVHGCVTKNSDGSWAVVDPGHGMLGSDGCAASGTFTDSSQTASNFGKLRIVTSSSYSDLDQAYAAGFLEGYLTAARIYDHHYNLKQYFVVMLNESESLELSLNWLERQEEWANAQVRSPPPGEEEPYWQLLGLVQAQFEGLVGGYQARAKQEQQQRQQQQRQEARRLAGGDGGRSGSGEGGYGDDDVRVGWLERRDLMFMNSNGDVYDIIDALEAGFGGEVENGTGEGLLPGAVRQGRGRGRRNPKWADVDPDPVRMSLKLGLQVSSTSGKCSALIKVTGDLGELLLGHSTHDSFTAMTRIYKHYDFSGLSNTAVAAPRMSFSSYPGELFSDDDFYLLSSGLAVMETTNHIYVGDVYAPLSYRCVLSWQRIRLANWMASSGGEWVDVFGRHNSGTYNNQYMIVDTKRFIPHSELQPGLLWVVEQLPGLFKTADVTAELSRGYWPSYNVAYFPEVYVAAGYPDMVGAGGHQGRIERLTAMGAKKYAFSIRLLKYQIAPRAAIFRRDQGVVDSLEAMKHIMRYNEWSKDPGQPPFTWSDARWEKLPHRGMPDTFNFTFERMSPRDLPTYEECAAAAKAVAAGAGAGAGAGTTRGAQLRRKTPIMSPPPLPLSPSLYMLLRRRMFPMYGGVVCRRSGELRGAAG
ncbi:hypothetical protein VOLCADRAFT_103148 [Volvox carteri f. nagariensis]|uniref:Phospholipase B-like n=1 Tax=Volvox carteri f. nagariensis TaxID=3068 RepID=D8TJU8_VOLCA|nr:uncharacterized protein VOLCADRAFT_103148 [Volvox carteri f. nagariensis]EFJ51951.1 hypothetical protein VOLCADRAFT_103148 [Volvox carteri f. nagariensis]|eukprot:XP_002946725.1 hypothetical protein VOLCADRAFT_103148 [Volvox carteri f. nagariensis]